MYFSTSSGCDLIITVAWSSSADIDWAVFDSSNNRMFYSDTSDDYI